MERQQKPSCLHCTITPPHVHSAGDFVRDLRESVGVVMRDPAAAMKKGSAMAYGLMTSIPDGSMVEDFLRALGQEMYRATE